MREESGVRAGTESKPQNPSSSSGRDPDAIYQQGKLVGRVADSDVDIEAREVCFGEIYDSDHLLIPEECEFRNYKILIQRIADASKVDKHSGRLGRVLRGCVADILGYREQ